MASIARPGPDPDAEPDAADAAPPTSKGRRVRVRVIPCVVVHDVWCALRATLVVVVHDS